jgi:hypothetical protein
VRPIEGLAWLYLSEQPQRVAILDAFGSRASQAGGSCPEGDRSMATVLHIALQEGFFEDQVVVRINGDEVYRKNGVKTDFRIGLADSFDLPMREGPVEIEVELPAKTIAGSTTVQFGGTAYVAVSVDERSLRFKTSDQPFGYV